MTGAGAGIGEAIATALAGAGAAVAVVDIDESAARKVAGAIGRSAMPIQADCGDVASIDAMIQSAIDRYGRLDVVVNNAGTTRHLKDILMDVTEEDWDRIHRLNARGVFFCLQRAARAMIPRRSGAIINIASIAARGYAGTSNAAYAASKGAVLALTKTAAQQLGPSNITVNAICPGFTVTAQTRRLLAERAEREGSSVESILDGVSATIPIRRTNEPSDVAALAVFLASDGARNVTGQAYNVDGGLVTS